MGNKEMSLNELRVDGALKQKKGLHFILTSILIWTAIAFVHLSSLPIMTKNLLTFFCTAPLMPISYLVSRIIKVDFQNKENSLTSLGIIFSVNQMLYLLIAMWVYPTVPEKMVMVLAMVFGAHLLPYGWLYMSKSYYIFSVLVSFLALGIGLYFEPVVLALAMIVIEVVFSGCLIIENRNLNVERGCRKTPKFSSLK